MKCVEQWLCCMAHADGFNELCPGLSMNAAPYCNNNLGAGPMQLSQGTFLDVCERCPVSPCYMLGAAGFYLSHTQVRLYPPLARVMSAIISSLVLLQHLKGA